MTGNRIETGWVYVNGEYAIAAGIYATSHRSGFDPAGGRAQPTDARARARPRLCRRPACAQTTLALDKISLPPGFKIEVLARLDNPRAMVLGSEGTLFAGSMRAGNVYAIKLQQGAPARVTTVASGLDRPIGVAFRGGALYVSATDRVLRFDDVEHRLDAPPPPVLVSKAFPNSAGHGGKFIAFGPDGKLYVPSGAPCNICEPDSDRYANLMRMNPDGSALEVFARGIRNTVGFDWDPDTHEIVVHRQWPRHAGR